MTSFHMITTFYLPSARVFMQHILYDKFSYDNWCERVNKTHTDEQNLYFDNFF